MNWRPNSWASKCATLGKSSFITKSDFYFYHICIMFTYLCNEEQMVNIYNNYKRSNLLRKLRREFTIPSTCSITCAH